MHHTYIYNTNDIIVHAVVRPSIGNAFPVAGELHVIMRARRMLETRGAGSVTRARRLRGGPTTSVEFEDPAVSGTDPLIGRRGFSDMVTYCLKYGVRTLLVESGDRFARGRMVQDMGQPGVGRVAARGDLLGLCDAIYQPRKHRAIGPANVGGGARVGGGASAGDVETRPAEGIGFRGRLTRGQALA
jgi:hypothetical protein